jgi:hypothetical protein
MKTRKILGSTISLVVALLAAAAPAQAQSQDPRAWIQNGDYALNSGNTAAAVQNYNYAFQLAQQRWEWSTHLTLTQRYLAVGQETQALDVYRAGSNLAWNWAIDPYTLRLRANAQQVTWGERGLAETVNLWNNTLKSQRMSDYTRQWLHHAAKQAYDGYQFIQRLKTAAPPPTQTPTGSCGTTSSFSLTISPGTARPGQEIAAQVTFPQGTSLGYSWIGLFKEGESGLFTIGDYSYVDQLAATNYARNFKAPNTPGRYEIRVLLDSGYTNVGARCSFTVQ